MSSGNPLTRIYKYKELATLKIKEMPSHVSKNFWFFNKYPKLLYKKEIIIAVTIVGKKALVNRLYLLTLIN